MKLSENQIAALAPKPTAFAAAKKLASVSRWDALRSSDRVIWGEIRGSGSKPYKTQIDIQELAFNCSCPSRQFPCKHSLALLLVYHSNEGNFMAIEEPEWVKEWIDKRRDKKAKPEQKEKKVYTEEELAKQQKAKLKRAVARMKSVNAGIGELELWLKDLVRVGFLHLPSKSYEDFENVAKRMVDAKAPGLANWVRSYAYINYSAKNEWQKEALEITAKLNLIIQSFKNYDQLEPLWQLSLRNIVGWNQSTKELLGNKEIKAIHDDWIVIGQETEERDDIVTERNWLWSGKANRGALVLNFGTRFSALESKFVAGSIVDAKLKFFPSVWEQRAALEEIKGPKNAIKQFPELANSWKELRSQWQEDFKSYPLANNIMFLIKWVRIIEREESFYIMDQQNQMEPLHPSFSKRQIMTWMVYAGNQALSMAGVLRGGKILPFGVFLGNRYLIIEKAVQHVEWAY
ncbi:MAG: SWIM zinc finger family protein [Bacteroidota bacterium]